MSLCASEKPDVFVDLGANVGTFYYICSSPLDLAPRAIAVEPYHRNALTLRANLLINGILDRVEVHQVAVGRAAARLWLEAGPPEVSPTPALPNRTVARATSSMSSVLTTLPRSRAKRSQ